MSTITIFLGVGAAVLAATLFILFVALITALANDNIPEHCKDCPLLFCANPSTLPLCAECHKRHQSSTTHENL